MTIVSWFRFQHFHYEGASRQLRLGTTDCGDPFTHSGSSSVVPLTVYLAKRGDEPLIRRAWAVRGIPGSGIRASRAANRPTVRADSGRSSWSLGWPWSPSGTGVRRKVRDPPSDPGITLHRRSRGDSQKLARRYLFSGRLESGSRSRQRVRRDRLQGVQEPLGEVQEIRDVGDGPAREERPGDIADPVRAVRDHHQRVGAVLANSRFEHPSLAPDGRGRPVRAGRILPDEVLERRGLEVGLRLNPDRERLGLRL